MLHNKLLAGLLGVLGLDSHILLFFDVFLVGVRSLDDIAFLNGKTGLSFGDIQCVCILSEFFVDRVLLEGSTVCTQSHINRNSVSSGVLPIGDAGGDIPLLLVFKRQLAGRRPHNSGRRGGGASSYPLMFELGGVKGV